MSAATTLDIPSSLASFPFPGTPISASAPPAFLAMAAFFYTAAASLGRTFAHLADPETEVDVKGTCQAIHAYRMLVNVAKELDAAPSQFVATPSGGSSCSSSPGTPISASAPLSPSSSAPPRLCVENPCTPTPTPAHTPPSPVRGPAPFVSSRRRP